VEGKKKAPQRNAPEKAKAKAARRDERPAGTWADEASKARTAGDPRARTPHDPAGQPSDQSFDQ
jgi:hypothetical protein